MGRTKLMRAPLKYVQGKDCLLHFYGDTSELGKNYLFVCSRSGHKACHAKIENSFADSDCYRPVSYTHLIQPPAGTYWI